MTDRREVSLSQLSAPDNLILKTLVEAIPSIVFLVDWIPGQGTDRSTMYLSPYVEHLTGVPAAEVLVKPDRIERLIDPDHVERFRNSFSTVMKRGDGRSESEYRIWNEKEQEWRWMLEHLTVLPGERSGTKRILGMVIDITRLRETEEQLRRAHRELKEHQEQLIRSEKMASLGLLAAGVAHEINNPIGYASSNVQTLKGDLGLLTGFAGQVIELAAACARGGNAEELVSFVNRFAARHELSALLADLEQMIGETLEGLARVRDIVEDLKNFARPEMAKLEVCNINRQINAALKITRGKIASKCEIETRLGDIPPIMCRPGQLTQVFANLLVNASEAITGQGRVRVESRLEGDRVIVSISDTGRGIEPEHLKELFDPFFTTKPVGEGTGLGLSVSYGIVKDHNGTIEVSSEPGEGSTFSVCLPIGRTE